jgi:hypothetical protein
MNLYLRRIKVLDGGGAASSACQSRRSASALILQVSLASSLEVLNLRT